VYLDLKKAKKLRRV